MYKISVVIVEYYSLDDVRACIDSYKKNIPDIEIIISSNSMYSIEQQQLLLQEFADCVWSFNDRNGGFAYGMNRGLSLAKGDYLIISNPDCLINKGILQMAAFMTEHAEIGAIAPRIIDKNGNIQDSCRMYVTLPRFVFRQIHRIIHNEKSILTKSFDYDKIQTVDWVIGAFIMVRKDVYRLTNGLCEDYFMYAEDLDWCTRIRQSGYEIVYYPKAEIIYEGSRNARKSKKYAKIFLKSHLYYWRKFGFFFVRPRRKIIYYTWD